MTILPVYHSVAPTGTTASLLPPHLATHHNSMPRLPPTAAPEAPPTGVAASPPPHTAAASSSSSWRLPVLLLSLCWCLCFSVLTAPQHGQSAPLAGPQLGSCASSGRASRLQLGTPRARPAYWAPSHCRGCSSEPLPEPPIPPPLTTQACAATLNLAGALFSDSAYHTLPLALTTFSSGLYNLLLPCELRRLGRWRAYLLGATLGSVGGLTCCMPQGSNPVTSRQGTRQACYSHV